MKSNRAFTLIELLVVVAIIGILASVVLASLNSARAKARDARRMNDITQIQRALEMYYNDNGFYPKRQAADQESIAGCGVGDAEFCSLITDLASNIKFPIDPLGISAAPTGYRYYYDSNLGDQYQTYGLMLKLETSAYSSKMLNDGGHYDGYYEVGTQPSYCKTTYNGDWFNTGNVCAGGN